MSLLSKLRSLVGPQKEDGLDEIASLMLAAKEDEKLRNQILFLVRAPAIHRNSLVATALHEMELRGESKGARAAFALLGTEEGARAALELLSGK
jgi:hypothetical protein